MMIFTKLSSVSRSIVSFLYRVKTGLIRWQRGSKWRFTKTSYAGPSSEADRLKEAQSLSFVTGGSDIQFADIRTDWIRTRAAIEDWLAENPEETFTSQDIYDACRSGSAMFLATPDWFCVIQIMPDPKGAHKSMYLWLAIAHNRNKRFWVEHALLFDRLAKALDCRYIEASTHSKGVCDYLASNGFELKTYHLAREINGPLQQKQAQSERL
jgi:hypothetical protein